MTTKDRKDKEFEFYSLEQRHGREEAILIAAEEWGESVNIVKQKVKEWEDILKWL